MKKQKKKWLSLPFKSKFDGLTLSRCYVIVVDWTRKRNAQEPTQLLACLNVHVYFRPQCLLYYFYVCVLDMPHRARLQPSSLCSDVLDHLFLSLCWRFLILFKRGMGTEHFGLGSANGK